MYRYAVARFDPEELLGGHARVGLRRHRHRDLPPFLTAQLRVPLHRGRGVRRAPARGRRRPLEGGRRRAALPPAGLDRAGHAPGRATCTSSSRERVSLRGRGRGARARLAAARPLERSGNGRPDDCSRRPAAARRRPPPRAGAATRYALLRARRASARSSCAGAGTRRATRGEFAPALRAWAARGWRAHAASAPPPGARDRRRGAGRGAATPSRSRSPRTFRVAARH